MERDISCALAVLHWQVLQFYTQPKAGAHRDEEEAALREAAVAFCSSAAEGQPLVVAVRLTGGGAARYLVRPTAKAAPTGKGKGRGAKGKRGKRKRAQAAPCSDSDSAGGSADDGCTGFMHDHDGAPALHALWYQPDPSEPGKYVKCKRHTAVSCDLVVPVEVPGWEVLPEGQSSFVLPEPSVSWIGRLNLLRWS